MKPSTRLRLSRSHRALGMLATVPVVAWIVSSFVLHGVTLVLPNGLQGVYELEPYHAGTVRLEEERLAAPDDILARLAEEGLGRIYWMRLESLAGRPVYVVKPGPFELERAYDALTAERLDPLPQSWLRAIADEQFTGTSASELHAGNEFNRYYTLDPVPTVAVTMQGEQPSELILSRASGRVLSRTDPLAAWFETAYRSVHVWQWGDSVRVFTALLYGLVAVCLTLVGLGYTLWWTRRGARRRWTDAVRAPRRIHARLAPLAGFLLATQMLVGAYLWFNLGLIEPRFRGQGSFAHEWTGGISVEEHLADASTIAAALPVSRYSAEQPIQRYEWRAIGHHRFWLAYPRRDENGILLDAATLEVLERLTPELCALAGESVVSGVASGPPAESTEYWMDFNKQVPTYRFRFAAADDSDVHVSQITGEIVQRRPAIWRIFGPFLLYHTFGFSGNPLFDTVLLSSLQLAVLTMVGTGWMLALRKSKGEGTS